MENRWSPSRFYVLLLLLMSNVGLNSSNAVRKMPAAIYIFGDSTMDVGTNNFLNNTIAKANFLYNGIDFPNSVPTGRFSNGYNTADMIAKRWGYDLSPPPFFAIVRNESTTFAQQILKGVNFASGGSGILNNTGFNASGEVVPFGQQIQQFSTVCDNIKAILGPENTTLLLSQSVFLISVGSNDIFDYQRNLSRNPCPNCVSAPEFLTTLLLTYQNHLLNLYTMGARKFAIISIPPIGCSPFERSLNNFSCCDGVNVLAQAFFNATGDMLQQFSSQAQGMNYSLGNAYNITFDMIDYPRRYGLKEAKAACCGNGTFPCNTSAVLCPYRSDYLFWDRFHPTQRASELAAKALFVRGPKYVTPINFRELGMI